METLWEATIYGETCSKANSRRIVFSKKSKRRLVIKSEKAINYCDEFNRQADLVQPNVEPYEGKVAVFMEIAYCTRRPDLDESLILDLLQGRAYKNDRQVVEKHIKRMPECKEEPYAKIIVKEL
jgi:Holliday junction resolvase RusA-like endonuclease